MSPMRFALFALVATGATPLGSQTVGSPAPDFALRTLAGDTARLSPYRGHPVLLNFWASWCTPCRDEMHDVITAYDAHQGEGLIVLAIDMTDQERLKDVRKFVTDLKVPFPVLLDEHGKVRDRFALRGIPTSMFIDARGVVRLVHQGPVTTDAMRRGLAMILTTPR